MHQLWLIPALPFAGFLINGILGRRFSKATVNAIAIGSVALSFVWALKTVLAAQIFGAPQIRVTDHKTRNRGRKSHA